MRQRLRGLRQRRTKVAVVVALLAAGWAGVRIGRRRDDHERDVITA
jgi:hypothetical protein